MPIETAEFTFADHFKEWCELYDEAHVDVDSYRELKAALINAFPMIRKAITEKDAQIAELNDERAADGEAIRNLQDMVQSANERIEALTGAQMCDCCDGKGNTLSGAPCICSLDGERGRGTIFGERMGLRMECFDLQRQLSALQRAAREYVDDIEADIRGIKPRDGRLLRALMDLLK